MEEKNEIKDAEIIEEKEFHSKKVVSLKLELALFLILGFLLGVVIKTEAVKRITIGFNDNSIPSSKQAYDFEKIKQDLAKQGAAAVEQNAQDSNEQSSEQPISNNQ